MRKAIRVFTFAMITSVLLGLMTSGFLLLASAPRTTVVWSFSTAHGFSEWLSIATASSLPLTIPPGVLGGMLAARMLARENRHFSRGRWVMRGGLWGCMLGILWPVVSYGLGFLLTLRRFNQTSSTEEMLFLLSYFALLGAITGTIVGILVGIYASRVTRHEGPAVDLTNTEQPPNPPLQPTGHSSAGG